MKNFALIGAAGYVAPRHLKAIKETKNNLLAALDSSDSVGIIDNFFPKASFFVEPERFDRYLEKQKHENNIFVDYLSICTPNYLHDSHIRMALRGGSDAICEKPLVLNPWNIDALKKMEEDSGRRVWNVLQLRVHPSMIALKNKIDASNKEKKFDVDLTYLTSRGNWYYSSWKGSEEKSGGIATNIGVHFYDMLYWIFGEVQENIVHIHSHDRASGYLEFEKARVRWFLSINEDVLPSEIKAKGERIYRSITINGEEIEFSNGFDDLHTRIYEGILSGKGYGLEEARKAIEIVHEVRNQSPVGLKGEFHPFAKKELKEHPFNIKKS